MACLGIQGFIADSLLLMPQSSSVTTKSFMYLSIITAVIWVQFSMNFCLNYWHHCLTVMPPSRFVRISGPSVTFLNCISDPTNLLPKIFQWLHISNSMKSKPLRMTHKFLCNRSSACLSRLISAGPLTLHLFILNNLLFLACTKALSPWGISCINSPTHTLPSAIPMLPLLPG